MTDLPKLALSVRQPWAWAIIHAGKDIENRSWQAINHGLRQRGRIAIHAAKGMTREEYDDTSAFMSSLGVQCPKACDLLRGGVIGSVYVADVVTESDSPWFFGPRGLVLRDPRPCEFIPAVGALGYFKWQPADASVVPTPARWMCEVSPEEADREAQALMNDLFQCFNKPEVVMTKAELKKSHDTMARFLVNLCRESDKRLIFRSTEAERHYRQAIKLIKRAGFRYEPEPRP